MEPSYWERITSNRLTRRRALTASATAAAAAAFLAACGGSDDNKSSSSGSSSSGSGASTGKKDTSGLLANPTDETAKRTRGGTLNISGSIGSNSLATATLEQSAAGNGSGSLLVHSTYNQLMRAAIGNYNEPAHGVWEPEFAQSYEQSPDGLSVTFKLRGLKFDNRAPTNGRVSNSGDVKYSWERFVAKNLRAPELANAKSADAPVVSVTPVDDQTVTFKMAFPFAPFFAYLGSSFFPFMYPVEAEGGYDTRGISRGSGAWTLPDNRPTGDAEMTRNPNYSHNGAQGEPYFDKLFIHSVSEYATIRSQFQAGNLDFYLGFLQEDVLKLKKDSPKLVMYQRPYHAKGSGGIFFGRKPGSVWNDQRVRQALAMNMDADLWGDTASNRKKFESEGLPVDVKWFARAGAGYSWFLDPQKDQAGPGGKFLKYNPAEAKKLLQAAGVNGPVKSTWHTLPDPSRDQLYAAMNGIFQESGDFKFDQQNWSDQNQYYNNVRNTGGNFEGHSIAFYFDHHDYDWTMYLMYNKDSTDFWMKLAGEDPKMTDFVNRQRRELDNKKREAIWQDFVKYDLQQMNYLPYHWPADWEPYYIGQPWLGGWGWWQPWIEQYPNGAGQILSQYWYDASKKT